MNFIELANTFMLLAIAVLNVVTLYYTRQTEKNTNSITAQWVALTAKSSKAEGKEEQRQESLNA